MSQTKIRHKSIKVKEFKNIVKDDMIPFFDDEDGEFITMLTPDTVISIARHFVKVDDEKVQFFGFNIYADNKLLETKDTYAQAFMYVAKIYGQARKKVPTN